MAVNVNDLVPEAGHEYKYEVLNPDGTSKSPQEFIYLRRDFGTPALTPTPVNRELLMAMQGFVGQTTVFNVDGSITSTNSKGETLLTSFLPNGDITELFTSGTQTITKTTTFNVDGSISEVIT
jgi:hypothetical protein